jgi:hypothetical protein
MIDRLNLATLSKPDEEVLLRWQHCKIRFDAMELFGLHDQATRDAYFDALEALGSLEDSDLARLAKEAKAESGEAARLKLVELSFQIPISSRLKAYPVIDTKTDITAPSPRRVRRKPLDGRQSARLPSLIFRSKE